jgi:hypothetical protein
METFVHDKPEGIKNALVFATRAFIISRQYILGDLAR